VGEPSIFLASASPRRSELLRQIGIRHEVRPTDVDEARRAGEATLDYVRRVAEEKAHALWATLPQDGRRPVLAADTAVELDGRVFGKPSGRDEAVAMLTALSGRTHAVHTAVAVLHGAGSAARVSSTRVSVRELAPAEIDWYWGTGEPADKAGAYAAQGRGAIFIQRIEGSYSGVVGLPLYETWELLLSVPGLIAGGTA
jgi:septum formation protein